jgi:signal transduction histidine kinase
VTRRLVVSYVTIAVVAVVALGLPLGLASARAEREHFEIALERDAGVIASLVEDELQYSAWTVHAPLDAHLASYPYTAGSELVIVDRNGRVVHADDASLGDAAVGDQPAFAAALAGERSVEHAPSELTGHTMIAVTLPVASGGEIHGAVQLAAPADAVEAHVRGNWLTLLGIALLAIGTTGLAGAAIARSLSRPVLDVSGAVARFAKGDLDVRAPEDRGPREQRELAHRFNQMAEQLGRLLRAQQAFVSDASHQLRSPLTALRLELEELELGLAADDAFADGIRRAIAETHRLSRLVADLLALARADVEVVTLSTEDAAATLRSRAGAWQPLAAERCVHLALEVDEPLVVASVSGHLAQILDDLLDNALEVAPPGSTVTVRGRATGDRAELHVVDAGPGLDDETRRRAFDRFWRGPSARPGAGTGLGLAIARQLARLSGGEVELRDAPAGGTDAVVSLRLAVSEPRPVGSRPAARVTP